MRGLAGLLVTGTLLLAGPALADACVTDPARAEPHLLEVASSPAIRALPGTPAADVDWVGTLGSLHAAPRDADPAGECWALLLPPDDPDRRA